MTQSEHPAFIWYMFHYCGCIVSESISAQNCKKHDGRTDEQTDKSKTVFLRLITNQPNWYFCTRFVTKWLLLSGCSSGKIVFNRLRILINNLLTLQLTMTHRVCPNVLRVRRWSDAVRDTFHCWWISVSMIYHCRLAKASVMGWD